MISFNSGNFNSSIKDYYSFQLNLDFSKVSCPNCKTNRFVRWAYYKRNININDYEETISILRIKCKSCGQTHAVLPSFIVPYLHHSIEYLFFLYNEEKLSLSKQSEYIIKLIRAIKSKCTSFLHALLLPKTSKLIDIVRPASNVFNLCFMQIHRGNYFCLEPIHITWPLCYSRVILY